MFSGNFWFWTGFFTGWYVWMVLGFILGVIIVSLLQMGKRGGLSE